MEFFAWIALALLSALLLKFGLKKGFFTASLLSKDSFFPLRWYHVLTAFLCYVGSLGVVFLFAPFSEFNIQGYALINFSAFALIFITLAGYLMLLPRAISRPLITRDHNFFDASHFKYAGLALLIAFPCVIFLNECLSFLICFLFHITELPDQTAVRFLKATLEYPLFSVLTIVTIVVLGPIIEEILFRGFLQSWIRQHLGSQKAIWLSSACFSFFHYSYDQGLANIPIIGSLLVFAYFLGFVYEKKGSLSAPITLHALFNACNVLSLYLFGTF